MNKAKGELLRTIFKLATLTLLVGSTGYFLALQTISAVNSKNEFMKSWIRGDIHGLGDPKLENIFAGLADKLVKIGEDVKHADSRLLKLELVTPEQFASIHKDRLYSRAYLGNMEVNLGMGLIISAKDERYTMPATTNQGRASISRSERMFAVEQDRERFSKGLFDVYSVVKRGVSNPQSIDENTYSDVLLRDYFGVYDEVKAHYPEIKVLEVYIASSETGTLAIYPALNSSSAIRLDDRPWYQDAISNSESEHVTGRPDVGLAPFYLHFNSGGYARTLWHRFEVETPTGVATYVVCVDVILMSDSWVFGVVFSNSSTLGRLGNSVVFGLTVSVLVLILGTVVGRYISGKPVTGLNDKLETTKLACDQFYSCFISYSIKDEEFAKKLYKDLIANGVPCWFAQHDIRGGAKIHEQIFTKIESSDRLLLILSKNSMSSNWVSSEIAKARELEKREGRRVLFPIRLVTFDEIQSWSCFDADVGKDSAREIREYFIPDFSEWKNKHKYNEALARLLKDFRAN